MYYSKNISRDGKLLAVQTYKTKAARDIACEAFGFQPMGSYDARLYIARDETAARNHVSYLDRDTDVEDMHNILEYWEDDEAYRAAREAGEWD